MSNYKELEDKDGIMKIDKDLIEIQKTIIYFGNKILEELKDIKEMLKVKNEIKKDEKAEKQIINHLKTMKIPNGYGGNNLKW
jgi:hypothetical protein